MNRKSLYKYVLPIIHFILSFFYERKIFIFEYDKSPIATIAMNNIISDKAERIIGYFFAKIFAAVFILFLWEILFYVIKNIRKLYVDILLVLACAGGVLIFCLWPATFAASADNYITFTYALRFWPEYWHSIYTSFIYSACMMVLPFPIFISVFQWIFACFTMSYIFIRIRENTVLQKGGRFLIFVLFLMPRAYTLFTDSYRTEIYTWFCVLMISKFLLDLIENRKMDKLHFICFMVALGLLSVWRTEGIILGVLLFVICLLFMQKFTFAKSLVYGALMAVIIVVFMLPQKLGDLKYYGKDYSFINSFPTLQNILNESDSDLSYEGAEKDLTAIDALTPIELLKKYGMDGYRRYNYAKGRLDINQSMADKETADEYMKAYYSLVLHNPMIYAKTQISMLMKILMIRDSSYVVYYNEEISDDLPPWHLNAWDIGYEDLRSVSSAEERYSSEKYGIFLEKVMTAKENTEDTLRKIHFYSFLLIIIPLMEIYIVVRELILLIKKQKSMPGIGATALALLMQAAAIVMVMPAAYLVYLHAFYCASLVTVIVYFTYRLSIRKEICNEKV